MDSYSFLQSLLWLMMACVYLPIQGIQIRVCNNRLERIQCPGNKIISIRRAFYGRNNPRLCRLAYEDLDRTKCGKNNNVLAKVKQMCDDKRSCSLRANKNTFGGNCPGNSAYLVVNFRCIGATRGCKKNQFKCLRNRKCIPKRAVCNGKKNCPDGSDEADCGGAEESCGKQAIQPQFITPECPTLESLRIVGGCAAKPNSWPWAIQLRNNMSIDGSYIHQCGAVLISPSFALTASHCFLFAPDASSWIAVAGRHQKDIQGNNDQIRPISKIIPFPNPTDNLLDRDLTMIKFSRPMTINNYVAPICLPHREPIVGDDCSVVGWGDTRDTGNEAVLKQTIMPIVDRDVCNNTNLLKGDITEYMVCAGWEGGKNDACQGDSGGPLMCNIDDAYIIQGIVSWGEDCAQPNLPGVYMNVHKAVDWIKDQMTKN